MITVKNVVKMASNRLGLLSSALALLASACAAPIPMNKTSAPSTQVPTPNAPTSTSTAAPSIEVAQATPTQTASPTAGQPAAGKGGSVLAARNALAPAFVDATNGFGFKLLNEVAAEDSGQNIFISPASVALAMAMVYNGAQGKTAADMAKTLGLPNASLNDANTGYAALQTLLREADPKLTLDIANSVWSRQGLALDPDFLKRTQAFYRAQISELDFANPDAAKTINQWVSDSTRGKIKEIVEPPISPDVVLFLVNAIYFKGNWQRQFDPKATRALTFTPSSGAALQTPMMFQTGKYAYLDSGEFQAVKLPYGDGIVSMVIVLPAPGKGLEQLRANLSGDNWRTWSTQFRVADGDITLPKFKLEYKQTLNNALIKLGMGSAFSDGADFRGMRAEPPGLAISEVKHKTFVEVNEEGTTAAAVTSAGMRTTSLRVVEHFSMTVDRPFFFAIQDEQSGAVLFSGLIERPTP